MIIESMSMDSGTQLVGSPAVSIIIPAYQAAPFIAQALDSIFMQTFTDYEVIVINDGSPDQEEMERALAPYRSRIRYVTRENGGPGAARNTGIRMAGAAFIAFLDADDFWDPSFLEEQMGFLKRNPLVDLVYCDAVLFGDNLGFKRTFMEGAPSTGEPDLEGLLSLRCAVNTSSVVVRRSCLQKVNLFDEEIGNYSEDYDLYLRLAHSGVRIAYHRGVLVHHRIHSDSLTSATLRLSDGVLRVLEKASRSMSLTQACRTALNATIARVAAWRLLEKGKRDLERGNYRAAWDKIYEANRYFRSRKLNVVLLTLRVAPGLLRRFHTIRRRHSAVSEGQ